jgi:hypothetical protein
MVKNLYKGIFNFPHKAYILRRAAYSPDQARLLMARAIANKQQTFISQVFEWMGQHPEDWKVALEIEWEEG